MFAASGLPVAERTSEATFIGQVDAARGVGTESAVSVMPSRCWRLGLAGSCMLHTAAAAFFFFSQLQALTRTTRRYNDQSESRRRDCE